MLGHKEDEATSGIKWGTGPGMDTGGPLNMELVLIDTHMFINKKLVCVGFLDKYDIVVEGIVHEVLELGIALVHIRHEETTRIPAEDL